jgi:DNA-binding MarR family transcriptional regulator
MPKDKKQKTGRNSMENALGFLLADTTRAMNRGIADRLARHGLAIGVYPFLRALREKDGVSQKDLADRLRRKNPTAVAAIRELERDGFVRRVDDPLDGRRAYVYLTAEGRKLFDKILPDVEDALECFTAGFSAQERKQFMQFLRRMRSNIDSPKQKSRD